MTGKVVGVKGFLKSFSPSVVTSTPFIRSEAHTIQAQILAVSGEILQCSGLLAQTYSKYKQEYIRGEYRPLQVTCQRLASSMVEYSVIITMVMHY